MLPAPPPSRALTRGIRLWGALLLALWGASAQAQRVVVLTFEGDRNDRLRTQLAQAISATGELELVPLSRFREVALRMQVEEAKAGTPEALAKVAPELGLDLAVVGKVGDTFRARILDSAGTELWSRSIPLTRRGTLSADNARRLAKAVVAALALAPPPPDVTPPPPEPEPAPAPAPGPPPPPPPAPGAFPGLEPVTVRLGVASTWRTYCARPRVATCAQYDALPNAQKPPGEQVRFTSRIPYEGLSLSAEFFPLSTFVEGPLSGVGFSAAYALSLPSVDYLIYTPSDTTEQRRVRGVEHVLEGLLLYRHGLSWPLRVPLTVGARAGFQMRRYVLDPSSPLPGSERTNPVIGVEVRVQPFPVAGLSLGAMLLPFASPGAAVRTLYGETASTFAWAAEAMVSGALPAPWGYAVQARYTSYADRFTGAGLRWTDGGAAGESYVTVLASVTARW